MSHHPGLLDNHTWIVIECPKCHATLPSWEETCQFCGASLSASVTQASAISSKAPHGNLWFAYNCLCVFWIAHGVADTFEGISGFGSSARSFDGHVKPYVSLVLENSRNDTYRVFLPVVGLLLVLSGVGLLLRNAKVREGATALCGCLILVDAVAFVASFQSDYSSPWVSIFVKVHLLVAIGASALMIYLIGETDRYSV